MSKTLRQVVPEIYAPLLSDQFDKPAVVETRATCDNCQMCDHGNAPPELVANFFRPDTKCCTYYPSIPNYLVGAILSDETPELAEGKRRIREKIQERIGVTPLWVGPSKKWALLYEASSGVAFGRAASLRCPYLDEEQRCSIWRHREVICSTYYCKYAHGVAGQAFWRAMKRYFWYIEYALARYAAGEVSTEVVEPDDGPAGKLSLNELEDRPVSDKTYATYWGPWLGRQEDFYMACYQQIKNLSKDVFEKDFDRTSRGREFREAVAKAYEGLEKAQAIPERVALNPKLRVLPVASGVVLTSPYNGNDSFQIENELYDVLKRFHHDTTVAETRQRMAKEDGIELEDDLLSAFTMHDILVPLPKAGLCETVAPSSPAFRAEGEAAFLRTSTGRWGSKQ